MSGQWRSNAEEWYRFARASLSRPYERGWYCRYSVLELVRARRASGLAFKLANLLDVKGLERAERYPAAAQWLDQAGILLDWLEW